MNDRQVNQFIDYYELLIDWNNKINLTSIVEFEDVIIKHFIDSASILNFYNVEKIIRIGTCGSINKECHVRDILLSKSSYSNSNFSYTWNQEHVHIAYPDNDLNKTIIDTAKDLNIDLTVGNMITSDVFSLYQDITHIYNHLLNNYKPYGLEMESFGLFYLSNYLKKKSACLCTVVDSAYEKVILSSEEKERMLNDMIKLALESIIKK